MSRSMGGRSAAKVPYYTIAILCLLKLFILCVVSLFYQVITVHSIDEHSTHHLFLPPPNNNNERSTKEVIAYCVTLTGCGNSKRYTKQDAMNLVTQGAAVLRHSVELAHAKSKYDFQMYALIHPSAKECASTIKKVGYTTLIRNTPFDADDIQGKFLREHIDGASCCGRKEYIKLYAYTLIQHPVAVVLDLDSLILQPLDNLFDALLNKPIQDDLPIHNKDNDGKMNMHNIEAFYTRDYNMVNPGGEEYAGVQGGFLMVKPNEKAFEEYADIVLEGDYREGQGWGGKYGYFFGGMQIQGICAYYYKELHPEKGLELNRCRINSMGDAPNFGMNEKKKAGECRDGREKCEDCRSTDPSNILSAHMTLCSKPWTCPGVWDQQSQKLCTHFHSEWHRIRKSFEESRTDDLRQLPDLDNNAFKPEIFHGYCKSSGKKGFLPIKV